MKISTFLKRKKRLLLRFSNRLLRNYTPRWVIFLIDLALSFLSIEITFFLLSATQPGEVQWLTLNLTTGIILLVQSVSFYLFHSYSGLIRYSGFKDAVIQLYVTLFAVMCIIAGNYLSLSLFDRPLILNAGAIIYGFILFSFLFLFRVLIKHIYRLMQAKPSMVTTYILGTESSDVAMADSLMSEINNQFNIAGFIDNHTQKTRNRIFNLPIFNQEDIQDRLLPHDAVIVGEERLKQLGGKDILNQLLEEKVKIYKLPSIQSLSEPPSRQLKAINLEDLLQRNPIKLDLNKLARFYEGKVILVTGAAGSIGSEIVRQLVPLKPQKILLLDQAETPLHDMVLGMRKNYPGQECQFIIANVRNRERMVQVFEHYRPQVIFHGAAYKHVPMMESNPIEALDVNFHGTRNLCDLAVAYHVERLVFVSTDKAVNPTNIMGASKRAAELYIQSLARKAQTTFIITRFGNVLGSNGSVVPYFKKQIENNEPVTVTHPDVTRYFMTIDEACQLVLEAGGMGNGGEIYVFDMGKPVKIMDLARHMIRLSGLVPDEDIKIKIVGLRPGEKLYEELLADKEQTKPTHHEKILIAQASYEFSDDKTALLATLLHQVLNKEEASSITTLKTLIPEYHCSKEATAAEESVWPRVHLAPGQ